HHFHGASTRVPVEATAFGLRRRHHVVEVLAAWEPDQDGAAHRAWADHVATSLAADALPGGYANLLGPDDHDQITHAYGPNPPTPTPGTSPPTPRPQRPGATGGEKTVPPPGVFPPPPPPRPSPGRSLDVPQRRSRRVAATPATPASTLDRQAPMTATQFVPTKR